MEGYGSVQMITDQDPVGPKTKNYYPEQCTGLLSNVLDSGLNIYLCPDGPRGLSVL
jgi:hypothetical protein